MRRALALAIAFSVFLSLAASARAPLAASEAAGWAPAKPISAEAFLIGSVALAVSGNGTVHAVWEDGGQLLHAYGSPAVASSPAQFAYGESPALVGGSASAVHLAFTQEFGDVYNVYAADWNGSAWSLPTSPLSTPADSSAPSIARYGARTAIAWSDDTPDAPTVYLATRDGSAPWTAGPVDYAVGELPDICADASGTHLLFQSRDLLTDIPDVFYTRWSGISWTLPVSVSDTADVDAATLGRLGCLGSERLAAWQQQSRSAYRIYGATGSASGWSEPQVLSGSEQSFSPAIATAPDSAAHLAWAEPEAVGYRQRTGGVWQAIERLNRAPNSVVNVAVAVAPNGNVHLAWVEITEEGTSRVMYTWKQGTVPVTPTPTATPHHRVYLPVIFR